jgi:hypothetical protein
MFARHSTKSMAHHPQNVLQRRAEVRGDRLRSKHGGGVEEAATAAALWGRQLLDEDTLSGWVPHLYGVRSSEVGLSWKGYNAPVPAHL